MTQDGDRLFLKGKLISWMTAADATGKGMKLKRCWFNVQLELVWEKFIRGASGIKDKFIDYLWRPGVSCGLIQFNWMNTLSISIPWPRWNESNYSITAGSSAYKNLECWDSMTITWLWGLRQNFHLQLFKNQSSFLFLRKNRESMKDCFNRDALR